MTVIIGLHTQGDSAASLWLCGMTQAEGHQSYLHADYHAAIKALLIVEMLYIDYAVRKKCVSYTSPMMCWQQAGRRTSPTHCYYDCNCCFGCCYLFQMLHAFLSITSIILFVLYFCTNALYRTCALSPCLVSAVQSVSSSLLCHILTPPPQLPPLSLPM